MAHEFRQRDQHGVGDLQNPVGSCTLLVHMVSMSTDRTADEYSRSSHSRLVRSHQEVFGTFWTTFAVSENLCCKLLAKRISLAVVLHLRSHH